VIAVELAATGWPLGLMLAAVVATDRIRTARRRVVLNRALHELRRPLQAMVLSSGPGRGPGSHSVRVALAALGDLDREINGGRRSFAPRPVACRALVQPAVERWRGIAASSRRSLVLRWRAGAAVVLADPDRIAQALDNLIDNALRHGGLRISVEATVCATGIRIAIADSGRAGAGSPGRDRRHGHGLRIVAAVAAEHGGRFEFRRSPTRTVAVLELPLAPEPMAAARLALVRAADEVDAAEVERAATLACGHGGNQVEDERGAGVMR
jgi:signal transduction histidine kinase